MLKINERVAICDYCGAQVNADAMTEIYDGRMVCPDCLGNMLYCEDCGARMPSEDAVSAIDRYGDACIICSDCADLNYYFCEDCGRYVHEWFWNHDAELCNDCAEARYGGLIQSYHEGHPNGLEFFGDARYSFIAGHFGIELEVTTDEPQRVAYMLRELGCRTDLYHLENDCSVDGFEMIFQPMTLEYIREHIADIRHIFEVLNQYGATAEQGNGLHIHVSRTAFGNDAATQARRIALCMKAFAGDNYNRMRAASGRSYDAGDWCRDNIGIGNFNQKKQAAATRRADRYLAVNVQNTDTVEFRLGRSTVDCDDFIRWIQTIGVIVRRSESITPTQATDLDRWFVDAPTDLVEWLNSRDAMIREPLQDISTERYNEIIQNIARRICRSLWSMMDEEPTESEVLRNLAGCTVQELRAIGYDR